MSGQATCEAGDPSLNSSLNSDETIIGECESAGTGENCPLVSDELVHINNAANRDELPTYFAGNQNEVELDDVAAVDGSSGGYRLQSSAHEASMSVSDNCHGNSTTVKSSSSIGIKPPMSHSTLSDANFVENYFKVNSEEIDF